MVGRDVTGASGVRTVLWAIATIVSPIVCVASGLVWAYAAVVAAAALDGQPTEYYDAGNRFAFAIALMGLGVVCPSACLGGYMTGRMTDLPRLRSLAIGQLAAAVPAVVVLVLLA
jgi:hypothetical protein